MARVKKAGNYQIPFYNGEMMEYVACYIRPGAMCKPGTTYGQEGFVYGAPTEWRDNYQFTARLKLNGHWRGRSSARVGVKNEANGEEYSMGFAAFYDAVEGGTCKDGYIEGTWTFRKQGANYILVPVDVA